MGQDILTSQQKAVLALIAKESKLGLFYLSGGTALAAYYLKHRFSDDLDFFALEAPDMIFLHAFAERIKETLGAERMSFQHVYDRNIFEFVSDKENLKVEFTKYPFPQLEQPIEKEGINVDSFRDVAANKLMALLDRFDSKDFVDLYFILQARLLEDIWHDVEKKFNTRIDPVFLGGELAKVRRVTGLPHMLRDIEVEELKSFFTQEAKKLSPLIFP